MPQQYLNPDFQPGEYDVVCGRGKKCYAHQGNLNFRQLCSEMRSIYTAAKTKDEKSQVVGKIIGEIRRRSPEGGFVKQDRDGKWYEVGDFLAREKTSQAFREILHSQYKSSTVSRRKERQTKRGLRGAEENNDSCGNSTSECQNDRRHSTPVLAHGLAEAINAARRELGDIDDDEEENGNVKKKAKTIPRRSSDPMISHLKLSSSLYHDYSTTTTDHKEVTHNATFPIPGYKKMIPNHESWSLEKRADRPQAPAKSSFPTSSASPSLPDIPISALLKDGKPINVNQDALQQACEMYALHNLQESAVGYWGHYNARS